MNNLKPLVKTSDLNEKNLANFKNDTFIIKNNAKLTNEQICDKLGITNKVLAGRRTSLVRRNHLVNQSQSKLTADKIKQMELNVKSITDGIIEAKTDNSYTNEGGENKEIARLKMTKYIANSIANGLILSLPFSSCLIEKKILVEKPNATFLGVERKKGTYLDLRATIRAEKLPIEAYHGDLGTKIYGKHENTYSHIIADYCGQLPTFSNEIEYAIRHKVVKVNGIIAMTFSKPIRGITEHSKGILALGSTISNNPNDNRVDSDKATEAYINSIIGKDFQFVEIFNYTDPNPKTGMGTPMTLVILKRIR